MEVSTYVAPPRGVRHDGHVPVPAYPRINTLAYTAAPVNTESTLQVVHDGQWLVRINIRPLVHEVEGRLGGIKDDQTLER